MKMKHGLSLFSFLLICIVLMSSVLLKVDLTKTYDPMLDKAKNEKSLLTKLDRQYEKDIENLPKKYKKLYKEFYNNRYEQLQAKITEKHYLYDEELLEYVNGILDEIYEANPRIPKEKIRIFIDRGPTANAYCTGEGTIAINIGLLHLLENESQLAFILCHEIAHLTLDHVNKNIERKIEQFKDKDARKEAKEKYRVINKMSSNRTKAIVKMKRDFYYAESRHSRINESSADKKGLEYYLNTSFDPLEAASTMLVLVGTDSLKYNKSLDLKYFFDNEGFEFKDRWLKLKEGNFKLSEEEDDWLADYILRPDSLKTHPDCMKRKAVLEEKIAEKHSLDTLNSKQASYEFLAFKQKAEFEWIESFFYYGRLDMCLYNSLHLLEKYPDNAYLHSMVGLCWIHMAYAQEVYELNLHVNFPKRNTPPNLKVLLEMIQNMGMTDMKKIGNCYLKSKEEHLGNEHFLFATIISEYQLENTKRVNELKKKYYQSFPDGQYKIELKDL